jgi:hypothetical protein
MHRAEDAVFKLKNQITNSKSQTQNAGIWNL